MRVTPAMEAGGPWIWRNRHHGCDVSRDAAKRHRGTSHSSELAVGVQENGRRFDTRGACGMRALVRLHKIFSWWLIFRSLPVLHMSRLEEITPGAAIKGILPDSLVTAVNIQWFGSEALELTYKDATGRVANQLLYRHDEPRFEIVAIGRPWSFDRDGALFRLLSEAQRIRLAHLFDPVLAVHTSLVDRKSVV